MNRLNLFHTRHCVLGNLGDQSGHLRKHLVWIQPQVILCHWEAIRLFWGPNNEGMRYICEHVCLVCNVIPIFVSIKMMPYKHKILNFTSYER